MTCSSRSLVNRALWIRSNSSALWKQYKWLMMSASAGSEIQKRSIFEVCNQLAFSGRYCEQVISYFYCAREYRGVSGEIESCGDTIIIQNGKRWENVKNDSVPIGVDVIHVIASERSLVFSSHAPQVADYVLLHLTRFFNRTTWYRAQYQNFDKIQCTISIAIQNENNQYTARCGRTPADWTSHQKLLRASLVH